MLTLETRIFIAVVMVVLDILVIILGFKLTEYIKSWHKTENHNHPPTGEEVLGSYDGNVYAVTLRSDGWYHGHTKASAPDYWKREPKGRKTK